MTRAGVIGVGQMGSRHAHQLLANEVKGMKLSAVCDSLEANRAQFPDVAHFEDAESLLASPEVDAVLIATPHYSHTTIGVAALHAGKHVLVEKPISVHKLDCETLLAAHQNKDLIFAAVFNQRTHPLYQKLKMILDSGELGEICRINWIITDWFRTDTYYSSGGWRATWAGEGGGVLLNQCPHQLDLFQWLFGMPQSVRAFCGIGKYHDIEVEDEVTAFLQYDDGKTAVFITSTGEAPGTNRLEIVGDRGRLVVEGDKIQILRNETSAKTFRQTSDKPFARPETWSVDIPVAKNQSQHLKILQNFSDAIAEGAPLIAPASEGIHSVELANAMLLSTFENRTVELPIDSQHYADVLQSRAKASQQPSG